MISFYSKVINFTNKFRRPKIIVMFHFGRSGSRVVGDLMNQLDNCKWGNEVFLKPMRESKANKQIQINPISFLKSNIQKQNNKYYGIEIKFMHLEYLNINLKDLINFLKSYDVSFIFLKRHNILRKIVSSKVASENNKAHLKKDEDYKIKKVKISVLPRKIGKSNKSLIDLIKQYKERFEELEEILKDEKVLNLSYEEDIESNPLIAYRKICNFVNIKPLNPVINYKKTNPDKLSEIVINFDEVKSYLKDSEFSFMTDE